MYSKWDKQDPGLSLGPSAAALMFLREKKKTTNVFHSPAGSEPFDFEPHQMGEMMDANIKKIQLMERAE